MSRMPRITNSFDYNALDRGYNTGRRQALDVQSQQQNKQLGGMIANDDVLGASKFALNSGRLDQGMKLKSMHQSYTDKAQQEKADRLVKVAYISNTPEKWGRMIKGLRSSGVELPEQYNDFGSRDSVLAEYGDLNTIVGLFKQKEVQPTTLMKNLNAAGLQQGTPEYRDAILGGTKKGNASLNELNTAFRKEQLKALRLKQQGITPKLIAEERSKAKKANNITEGIEQLARIPAWAKKNDRDFEGAIGPMDSSFAGRAMGMFDSSEGEVRRKISGDTEALAAAIKPLIRKPGEGAWTDADQERLVSVVGDLVLAKDTKEYNRALAGVRDRINSNFGLSIPKLSFEKATLGTKVKKEKITGLSDLRGKVAPNVLREAAKAIAKGATIESVRARIMDGM